MKNLNKKQIAEVKKINVWSIFKTNGNTKRINGLDKIEVFNVIDKKRKRALEQNSSTKQTNIELLKVLIFDSKRTINTTYFKKLIVGNTGIYYASEAYGHSDYNKTRLRN